MQKIKVLEETASKLATVYKSVNLSEYKNVWFKYKDSEIVLSLSKEEDMIMISVNFELSYFDELSVLRQLNVLNYNYCDMKYTLDTNIVSISYQVYAIGEIEEKYLDEVVSQLKNAVLEVYDAAENAIMNLSDCSRMNKNLN